MKVSGPVPKCTHPMLATAAAPSTFKLAPTFHLIYIQTTPTTATTERKEEERNKEGMMKWQCRASNTGVSREICSREVRKLAKSTTSSCNHSSMLPIIQFFPAIVTLSGPRKSVNIK